jgi:hypothetical protein
VTHSGNSLLYEDLSILFLMNNNNFEDLSILS